MTRSLACSCVIAGGGPAGMMAGFLLARAGVDVIVLEKHEDFLRDFRGDTIHPSTTNVLAELGLLDQFLARSATSASASPISPTCRRAASASCSCRSGIS